MLHLLSVLVDFYITNVAFIEIITKFFVKFFQMFCENICLRRVSSGFWHLRAVATFVNVFLLFTFFLRHLHRLPYDTGDDVADRSRRWHFFVPLATAITLVPSRAVR